MCIWQENLLIIDDESHTYWLDWGKSDNKCTEGAIPNLWLFSQQQLVAMTENLFKQFSFGIELWITLLVHYCCVNWTADMDSSLTIPKRPIFLIFLYRFWIINLRKHILNTMKVNVPVHHYKNSFHYIFVMWYFRVLSNHFTLSTSK